MTMCNFKRMSVTKRARNIQQQWNGIAMHFVMVNHKCRRTLNFSRHSECVCRCVMSTVYIKLNINQYIKIGFVCLWAVAFIASARYCKILCDDTKPHIVDCVAFLKGGASKSHMLKLRSSETHIPCNCVRFAILHKYIYIQKEREACSYSTTELYVSDGRSPNHKQSQKTRYKIK